MGLRLYRSLLASHLRLHFFVPFTRLLAVALALWAGVSTLTNAQDIKIGDGVTRFPNQALATFGLVAIPNETASAISFKRGDTDDNQYSGAQIGGGFRFSPDIPIYLEGYLGFQRYNPTLILSQPTVDMVVPVRWTGIAATGGVGYDWKLNNNWSLRPILNVSVGHIASDASILAGLVSAEADVDIDFLISGGMTTGGLGGSLLLNYEKRSSRMDVDVRLRHTHLELRSIGSSSYLNARAQAISTALWGRVRIPVRNWRWQNKPIRSVWEGSLTSYSGDQGKTLGIDWLGRVGAGLEVDLTGTEFRVFSRARVIANYVFGEKYDGFSVGMGISF